MLITLARSTAWQQAFECLAEGNQMWVRNAPVLQQFPASRLVSDLKGFFISTQGAFLNVFFLKINLLKERDRELLPVLLLSVAAPHFGHNNQLNRWAEYDTGAASENLCLQATALGLVAHQMGGFDSDKAKATFNIPADHTCMAMIAVGHPGSIDVLPGTLREKEQAPRERKPLAQIVSEGAWAHHLSVDLKPEF